MGLSIRDVVAYILGRGGCLHPFYISRILALYEMRYYGEKAVWPTDARYVAGPGVFYIEGLKELIEGDECFVRREGDPARGVHGCIEYVCSIPEIPVDHRRILDRVIDEALRMDMQSLNSAVINHELFQRLLSEKNP